MTQESDRELVQKLLRGDEQAFEHFFTEYFPGLFRFALARLNRDIDAAEEVVQKALCKATAKLETYRGEAALFTWLCTFTRHEIAGYMKTESRLSTEIEFIQDSPEVRAALESLLSIADDRPDKAILRKEVIHMVQTALDALPSRYAKVLEWKYIDGLAVKEIAERLEVGLKAAESLLTRARQAFRDAFSSLGTGITLVTCLKEGGNKTP